MIELDKSGDGLWTVTLNRPDKANSLTHAMLTELADIAEAATEARALVLTGAGAHFCSGGDLSNIAASGLQSALTAAVTELTGYGLTVAGFGSAFWGALLISIVNWVLGGVVPDRRR